MQGRPVRPAASLSLDLDDEWSYLKVRGDGNWRELPSYLDDVVPRVLGLLAERGLRITFFVVGQDAALDRNREILRAIADAGHEVGNHSFAHEPWLALDAEDRVEADVARAEEAIAAATGVVPRGFRGPGFSCSRTLLAVLARRGYAYDASTLPTWLGPVARAYYLLTTGLSRAERRRRSALFGHLRDGLRPLDPYLWETAAGPLAEVPVTTLPILRLPIHFSYLLYLAQGSPRAADSYFWAALRLCRLTGTTPSLLLHPLDFLGREDAPRLGFFPVMGRPGAWKRERMAGFLDLLESQFRTITVGCHAAQAQRGATPWPASAAAGADGTPVYGGGR